MECCLLITTRGRIDCLERLFSSLTQQTHKNFHILLGLQEPTQDMFQFVETWQSKLQIVTITLSALSLSAARNRLIPYIKGEVTALCDDDCWYEPRTLEAVVQFFHVEQGCSICIGGIIGQVIDASNKPETVYSVFKNAPSWTIFFRSKAMNQIGFFDEQLGIGAPTLWQSGEETDFVLRGLSQNMLALRTQTVRVGHPTVNVADHSHADKWVGYGRGRMQILWKHNFPLWFKWANVLYPLFRGLLEGPSSWRYRWCMFYGRVSGLIYRCLTDT